MIRFVWMLAIPLLSQATNPAKYIAREKVYHYILGSTQVAVQVSHFGETPQTL
jgi:hypothetical protein